MIAMPIGLAGPAQEAGIEVPEDLDGYDPEKFVRWHLFCCAQIGTPMPSAISHWENAKVIASIPEERLKTVTHKELLDEFHFQSGHSK